MKKWWMAFGLCFFSFSVIAARPLMDVQKAQLRGGEHLYLVTSHALPIVDVRVIFRAGSSYDGHLLGLAHMTNALLNEGSGGKSAEKIANELSDEGAMVSFDSGRLMGSCSLRSMSDERHLKKSLSVFHEMLTAPNFSKEAFLRVKKQTIAAIKFEYQDPKKIASRQFFNALYPNLPYAHAPLGSEAGVGLIRLDQVRRFYQRFYVRANAQVIVVGDIGMKDAKALANSILSGLPKGRRVPIPQSVSLVGHAKNIHINFPSSQMTYYLGQSGVRREDPDYVTLKVGNELLGGFYQQSRLFDTLRNNHGLVYSINSVVVPYPFGGPMVVIFQTKDASAAQALALVNRTVKFFLSNASSQSDLLLVKNLLVGRLYREMVSNKNKVDLLSQLAFYDLPLNYYDEYVRGIRQVTVQDIIRAFSKNIHPDRWVTVEVGDLKKDSR